MCDAGERYRNRTVCGQTFMMIENEKLRRCRECETVFEPDVADRGPGGEPRCPQCLLLSSDEVLELDERELVIRGTTPFR